MSDSEIINLILQGEKEKYRLLVEKHKQMVFRTCIGFVHNKDDADDLTQEVFIKAYESLSRFRGESSFSTWLYRIAVNAALNRTKRSPFGFFIRKTGNGQSEAGTMDISELNETDTDNPESIMIRQEDIERVRIAVDSLPENQRTAIVLSRYDRLPQKKIAEIMSTTEGAVEALIQRAKKNLRENLTPKDKKK
jgi:RNA polymerase sigma-70 factor, ECF subfamily